MRRFGWVLGRLLMLAVLLVVLAFVFAPREPLDLSVPFDAGALPDDLDAYLAAEEAQVADITPEIRKRIVWTGAAGQKTPLSVVYLHGFSATSEEIRPVPDEVATALGANLFYTRLTGHGRPGAALADATATDWVRDMKEALAIGSRIGERVLVIGTSTGGTLAAIAATDREIATTVAGIVFVSPNFAVRSRAGAILDMPYARIWGPWIAGDIYSFEPSNAAHSTYWTTRYSTQALFPVGALVKGVGKLNFAAATTPALFIYSPLDEVVSAEATDRVVAEWGGPTRIWQPDLTPADDPMHHVITGSTLSPDQTAPTVAQILDWAAGL